MAVRGVRAVVGNLLLLAGFGVYEVLAHRITASDQLTAGGAAFMLVPLIAAAGWALAAEFGARRAVLALALVAVGSAAGLLGFGLPSPAIVYGLPHFAANAFLLWFFGRTLRADREPLITRIARRLRGPLPPTIETYTRRVTLAWMLFFAAQIGVSLLLYAFAPIEIWSLFINIVSSLLIPAMFVCEYTVRRIVHRDFDHVSIFAGSNIFAHDDAAARRAEPR